MSSLTEGFEFYFRPDPTRTEAAFEQGVIITDTNVLLNVLRYSPSARDELLAVLTEIQNRVFVPYQVAVEYNRNRVQVVDDRRAELEQTEAEIEKIRTLVRTTVNSYASRRIIGEDNIARLDQAARDLSSALDLAQQEAEASYDLDPDEMVGFKDTLTTQLEVIFGDRVGERPSDSQLASDSAEAQRRQKERLAPGFKDKSDGDYLWWAEVLRSPLIQGRPVVVVSDDAAKGDWRFEQRGMNVGPHPILLADIRRAGGTDLILLTTRDLLKLVQSRNPTKVSSATLDESQKALNPDDAIWSRQAYEELLGTLNATGYEDRAAVIAEAASKDGFVSRNRLYEVIGRDESSRSLRQFATPATKVMSSLIERGLLSPHAQEPLHAEYTGPGKTIGYTVPDEFLEHYATELDPEEDVEAAS
jgi:multidrug efflux pump subunit AcrA (membrane-fusion protein)